MNKIDADGHTVGQNEEDFVSERERRLFAINAMNGLLKGWGHEIPQLIREMQERFINEEITFDEYDTRVRAWIAEMRNNQKASQGEP